MMSNMWITLVALILILVITAISITYLRSKKGSRRIYKQKGPYLLSEGEKRFFEVLQNSIRPDMYICPKVRIADLVEMAIDRTDKEFWPKFNQISQKHVDFVICNKATFAPLVIIELDGGSHNENSRSLRDILVDDVFRDADIPMLHIPVSHVYQYTQLAEQITHAINKVNKS